MFGASNLILIFKLKNDFERKRYDYIFLLTLFSFLFINIFFYRLSEHGTDRTAQILIFILFIEILNLIRSNILLKKFFSKIFILLGNHNIFKSILCTLPYIINSNFLYYTKIKIF